MTSSRAERRVPGMPLDSSNNQGKNGRNGSRLGGGQSNIGAPSFQVNTSRPDRSQNVVHLSHTCHFPVFHLYGSSHMLVRSRYCTFNVLAWQSYAAPSDSISIKAVSPYNSSKLPPALEQAERTSTCIPNFLRPRRGLLRTSHIPQNLP